jgi:gamma-glutamyltranspeptidase
MGARGVAAHQLALMAGIQMLLDGANAVDAAGAEESCVTRNPAP